MRGLVAGIFTALMIGGCAARHVTNWPECAHQFQRGAVVDADNMDDATVASALVFNPPITAGEPRLELARDVRQPSAFVAYDQVFTTFFYLRLDDRQFISDDGRSQRRVVSETFGIRSR